MKTIKDRITGIIMILLSLLLTIGVKFIFPACAAKEDGSFMNCHWAEQAVFGAGIALCCISAVVLVTGRSRVSVGAALSAIPAAAAAALTPDILIPLCMMPTMHCHTVMRPAVMIVSALIAVTAAVHCVIVLKSKTEAGG